MAIEFPVGLGNITYEYDYHAGSDVLVAFENVLVDDIVRIAWGTQQVRTPIFGYASQYFNALAAGNVIGAGSFWIAFKESGYIPIILRHITSMRGEDADFYASPAMSPRDGRSFSTGLAESARLWEGQSQEGGARTAGRTTRGQIERLLQRQAAEPDNAEVQRDLQNLAVQLQSLPDREFEDLAELFEDALWYGGNDSNGARDELFSGNHRGGELSEDAFLALRRADQYPPFDIFVTFGDMNNQAANHTLHRLLDVSITNTEFGGIESSGEPIYVKYDFICRNSG
jgi:hypothetical protein